MILNRVKIKNYRQYRDVEIDFAKDSSKNFTIIKGNNGTGKTTLLNALTWCLYGKEIHNYGHYSAMSICNNKTANTTEDDKDIEVSVEIEFIDDENQLLTFKRSQIFYMKNGNLRERSPKTNFLVIKQRGKDFIIEENDQYTVQRTIPKTVEDYFFFDGARLGDYFQTNSNQNIKDAVYQLSQLNLLENITENLNKVIEQYTQKQKKLDPNTGNINEQINHCIDEISKLEKEQEKNEQIIEEAKEDLKDKRKQLIELGSTTVNEAVNKESKLEENIKFYNNKLYGSDGTKGLVNDRRELIVKTYPYMLTYNKFKKFLSLGEDSRERGHIPPSIKKSFLKDLLEEGKCICGCDLSEDDEHRKLIERLYEETDPLTDESESVTSDLNHVRDVILNRLSKFKEDSLKLDKDIRNYENKLDEDNKELKKVRAIIANSSVQKIRELEALISNLRDMIDNKNRALGQNEIRLTNKRNELEKLQTQLRKSGNDVTKYNTYAKKIEFCRESQEASKKIYYSLKEDMKERISELTKNQFLKIQWKNEEFIDINLNSNYEVSIINKTGGIEKPGDLSDGEKLCLGLCFMSALHEISGFKLPIVMDTPLGILDVDMKNNIAKFLPEFVNGRQIVLLVTGTEYDDDFRDILYDHIGKEYTISWKNSSEGKESKVI